MKNNKLNKRVEDMQNIEIKLEKLRKKLEKLEKTKQFP